MKRIPFLDYLRVIAIFMVLIIHSTEPYYFGADGNTYVASVSAAFWVTFFEVVCRACVPLFVMASAYLLFPVNKPTGVFLKRRAVRVLLPFAVWCGVYTVANNGSWGKMLFNFPMAAGGHLWFVPMMCGVYLLMPLLSPWAEKVSEKELRGWLLTWLFTTLVPFARLGFAEVYGNGWAHSFGDADFDAIPFFWGECPWNSFGTFQYVSGFVGYVLLGFWLRKFVAEKRSVSVLSMPMLAAFVGSAIMGGGLLARLLAREFPISEPYAFAVELEIPIEYCSLGVVAMTYAWFVVIRAFCTGEGSFYRYVIRPLSDASYGVYLVHILFLMPISAALKPLFPTPMAILATAATTFFLSSLAVALIKRIPLLRALV